MVQMWTRRRSSYSQRHIEREEAGTISHMQIVANMGDEISQKNMQLTQS
jgi:hypothetical protein